MRKTFSTLNDDSVPLYMRVYGYYKELIVDGRLPADSRIPSIRRCASELSVSRTTVEAAYLQLAADGYIVSRPQSGYYVTDIAFSQNKSATVNIKEKSQKRILYDFASLKADSESFDFDLWRRYLKSALRQDDRLLSYGEVQGEEELREVIAKYISEKRNVFCDADHVVIGAGVQSLLHILCGITDAQSTVAFKDKTFMQGIAVFNDHRFTITDDENSADILYVSPSHINRWGDIMPTGERLRLIRNAQKNGTLIIEDDYDSEFGYFNHPTPSLQGLDGGKNVVYIGTFSKLLLPSIRISFMILPDRLSQIYKKRAMLYNQTVSTTEQIALCQFIRDGHLQGRIRKVKKLYTQKTMLLNNAIDDAFGTFARTHIGETGFIIRMEVKTEKTADELAGLAADNGIAVIPAGNDTATGRPQILLSCSSVQAQAFHEAAQLMFDCFFKR